jgi:acetoin:2,6-dichlorophenolindophenol oxidoreductase subunit beta
MSGASMPADGGQRPARQLRYWEAGLEALKLEMRHDPKIVLLGEDIAGAAGREDQGFIEGWGGPYGGTRGLVAEFGRLRVIDTPISEAGFLGAAVGLASSGFRPWVEIMFPAFLNVCFDQLATNVAQHYQLFGRNATLPIVIKTLINHQGVMYSLAAHIPGLKVVAPSSPYSAKGLMIAALRDDNPVVVYDHIGLLSQRGVVPEEAYAMQIGKAEVARVGKDVTLVGISAMTRACLAAADKLSELGVDAEVVDLLSLSPIDVETIAGSARKTGRVVVVDEDYPVCSVARDVASQVAEAAWGRLVAAPLTLTPPHLFRPFSGELGEAYSPSADLIKNTVLESLQS